MGNKQMLEVDAEKFVDLLNTLPISHSQFMELLEAFGYTVNTKETRHLLNDNGDWIGIEIVTVVGPPHD